MKINNLTISAIGFASLAAAQNVYDTFSTSYTKLPVNGSALSQAVPATVPVLTSSLVRSNTHLPKPTTSVECWRNGYPCANGGQRSQRQVANFVRATPAPVDDESIVETDVNAVPVPSQGIPRLVGMAVAPRVPPPEFFSSRPDVHVPGETDEPTVNILPIPTEFLDGPHYDVPGETGEVTFTILPISTTPPEDNRVVVPTEWWRGPVPAYTIDCNRHYCPTNAPSPSPAPTSLPTTSYPLLPPTESFTTKRPAVPPEVTAPALPARNAAVPIDWWRGPNQPVGPVESIESIESIESTHTSDCKLHYCPSWKASLVDPVRSSSTKKTTTTTLSTVVLPTGTERTSFPAVPPVVPTGV
ncbi:hypothetical protein M3J07_000232 [Ascochyta lentis]